MIALGCDHGGYELMQEVKAYLDKQGLEYQSAEPTGLPPVLQQSRTA